MMIMTEGKHAYVAMSGGVDSTVAAWLLKEKGFDVTGIFMRTWRDPKWAAMDDSPEVLTLAQRAAESLSIPLVVLDVRQDFFEKVVKSFIKDYSMGRTPNPCLFCNPTIKWGQLQAYALAKDADYFATGHYARLSKGADGKTLLLRGLDPQKDQSYVLAMLSQNQLAKTRLPLGEMTKKGVRQIAADLNLEAADQADSQDLCFLGRVDYREFLSRFASVPSLPGDIVDASGQVLGRHRGLWHYTIGQRKGLRIAASEPYYVVDKQIASNKLVVAFRDQAGNKLLVADHVSWISGNAPASGDGYDVMIRYRAKPEQAALISSSKSSFRLEFTHKIVGVSPGQVAVLYRDEVCLGGGVIQHTA
jgi:tRNA-uridine 2-sulfurtransferase